MHSGLLWNNKMYFVHYFHHEQETIFWDSSVNKNNIIYVLLTYK